MKIVEFVGPVPSPGDYFDRLLARKLPPVHFGSPKCNFTFGANCSLPCH